MADRPKILAILPAFNEAGKVGKVVEKIKATGEVDEIVVVDDCSSDTTGNEAKDLGATVLRHDPNRGVGAAIRTGILYGIEKKFEIGVVLSSDDQHEPSELPRVLDPIRSGEFDFIQGSRRMKGGKVVNDRPFRMITTQLYSALMSLLVMRRITDATNGFRAFRMDFFRLPGIDINQDWLDRYELEPYILFKAVTNSKVRFKEVPITLYYHADPKQYTKMKPFRDWWRLARPLLFLGLRIRK